MYYGTKEATMMNKCTSVVGHFYGHSGALEQYRWHCPMRHVHGYPGSHWMLPSGNDYSLRIIPVAARATINKMTIKQYFHFAGHFAGHCDAAVRYHPHCWIEEVHDFTRSHWMPPLGNTYSDKHQLDIPAPVVCGIFHRQIVEKGHTAKGWPPITIGVWHIKMMTST